MFMNNFLHSLLGMPEIIIITMCIVILLGVAIFLLTGFIHVKKDYIAIIERVDVYVKMTKKRWNYFAPVLYRRAGYYYLGINDREINLPNGTKAKLFYEIKDVLLYHYSGHNIKAAIDRYYFLNNNRLNIDILKDALNSIGINFIEIVEIKKD